MIKITLPDGKHLEFSNSITVGEIAKVIGTKLAKDAIAGKVNDKEVDLSYLLETDATVMILTAKDTGGLAILRHSAAHLLAHAVCEIFPEAQPTVGPNIEDGFYHDFYYPPGFTEEDLPKIEAKMRELARANFSVVRSVKNKKAALEFYTKRAEKYKVMMIEDIPDEVVSFYSQGDFINACLGPHVPSTAHIKAFKLTKLSGAYWKGDSKNEMLQRIYGTAWADEKELKAYLDCIEQAKLRDHRLVGKKMDLFHLQEEAPGMVFWHPKGWTLYSEIKKHLSRKFFEYGYQEVNTPMLIDKVLWEKSGHWDKYRDVMFTTESESRTYAIKPMNCPAHVQILKQGVKSYRDLPIRFGEFGFCHRNEISGSLHGIMRIRGFVQDDGHIYCTEEQIVDEAHAFIEQVIATYADFGFKDIIIKLATRPENRIGSDEIWDKAEQVLAQVLDETNMQWNMAPDDGAFYGPKIEFSLRDCLGRVWQCGTLQVDFSTAERLGLHYITETGDKKAPVILHRAMLGSIERFIGILLEDSAGDLPLWLAPIQAVVVNITDDQADFVKNVVTNLQKSGCRAVYDLRNEKIGFKIREHSIAKVPFIVVIGSKEVASNTVSVRTNAGKDLGQMSVQAFLTDVLKIEKTNQGGIY